MDAGLNQNLIIALLKLHKTKQARTRNKVQRVGVRSVILCHRIYAHTDNIKYIKCLYTILLLFRCLVDVEISQIFPGNKIFFYYLSNGGIFLLTQHNGSIMLFLQHNRRLLR